MNIIKEKMPVTELLAALAEECAELAQASLKLRRVFDKTSPTPITEEQAMERFYEEIADVQLTLKQIDIPWKYIQEIGEQKKSRWIERLKGIER